MSEDKWEKVAREIINQNLDIYMGPDSTPDESDKPWYQDLVRRIAQAFREAVESSERDASDYKRLLGHKIDLVEDVLLERDEARDRITALEAEVKDLMNNAPDVLTSKIEGLEAELKEAREMDDVEKAEFHINRDDNIKTLQEENERLKNLTHFGYSEVPALQARLKRYEGALSRISKGLGEPPRIEAKQALEGGVDD